MESLSFFMYPFQVVCPIPLYDLQFTTTRDGKPTIRLNTINHRTITVQSYRLRSRSINCLNIYIKFKLYSWNRLKQTKKKKQCTFKLWYWSVKSQQLFFSHQPKRVWWVSLVTELNRPELRREWLKTGSICVYWPEQRVPQKAEASCAKAASQASSLTSLSRGRGPPELVTILNREKEICHPYDETEYTRSQPIKRESTPDRIPRTLSLSVVICKIFACGLI